MIGSQKYKLPFAKRRDPAAEEQTASESQEDHFDQDVPVPAYDDHDDTYQDDLHVEDPTFQAIPDDSDEYYFDEPQQQQKPSWGLMGSLRKASGKSTDINTSSKLEEWLQEGEKANEVEEETRREYRKRDDSEPMNPPPGYVWRQTSGSSFPFLSIDGLLHLIGVGDSAERFRQRAETDTELTGPLLGLFGQNTESALEEKLQQEKEAARQKRAEQSKRKMREEMGQEVEPEETNAFNIDELGGAVEDADAPPGWQFWHGPRWDILFHKEYETPTSWFFGYPLRVWYKIEHFLYPDLYEADPFKSHYGDWMFDWTPIRWGTWISDRIFSPCMANIAFSAFIIGRLIPLPAIFYRIYLVRKAKVVFKRTTLRGFWETVPVIWRRFPWMYWRKRGRRWGRFMGFFTILWSPFCFDLFRRDPIVPTEDIWEKNFLHHFTDGIRTNEDTLAKHLKTKPPLPNRFVTPPIAEEWDEYRNKKRALLEIREQHRQEVFGTPEQQKDDWIAIRVAELDERQRQLYDASAHAAAEYKKNASSVKL